jgi:hypothetical protein
MQFEQLREYSEEVTGWTTGIQFPERGYIFSLRHRVQTGSGAHPASYPKGIGSFFPQSKAAGA